MLNNNVELFPIIDYKVLEELRSIMDDEFLDVLQVYLDESLSLMNDIHTAFDENREQILPAVSALKSGSMDVGARRLAALAQRLEALVNKQDYAAAALMLGQLHDTFAEAHGELNEIVKNGCMVSMVNNQI